VNTRRQQISVQILRWTVGLVVLFESYQFAVSPAATRHLQGMGLRPWIAPMLGGTEIMAAILFLFPKLSRIGACGLLAIFAVAAILHVLHGQFAIGSLLVYGASVFLCASNDGTVPGSA
jgi:uncharacterized membrane protein YphA (DoxX/SURF4 family)